MAAAPLKMSVIAKACDNYIIDFLQNRVIQTR
jgi:hypothetical protein